MSDKQIPGRERIENALEFLAHSASEIGAAKARVVKAEKMIGHIEALTIQASDEKAQDARKADARGSQRYLAAINELSEATSDVARLYALREAAVVMLATRLLLLLALSGVMAALVMLLNRSIEYDGAASVLLIASIALICVAIIVLETDD